MSLSYTNLQPYSQTYMIKNGTQLAIDDFVCVDSSTGKIEVATSASGKYGVGVVLGSDVAGGTLLGNSGGTQKAVCASNVEIEYAVTGASIASLGAKVYISTKNTLTVTPPVAGFPFGIITNFVSGTTCRIAVLNISSLRTNGVEADILLLDGRMTAVEGDMATAQSDISTAQGDISTLTGDLGSLTTLVGNAPKERTIFLGVIGSGALEGTSALQLFSVPATEGYVISKFICVPTNVDAGIIAGSQVINLLINATPVTGGSVTVAFGSAIGTPIVGTCTAAKTVVSGDNLIVSLAASGTGFTAAKMGLYSFYAVVAG